ncbi:MAG: zinc-binding dehydrogenase [Eubacterium sp.]
MKAGIYLGKEDIEIRELPLPQVGDNDVLIKNIYSGICGTDVAVYKHGANTGHKITPGGEFGHETVSQVAAVGKNVKDFTVGERVYPYPLFAKNDTKKAGVIGGFSEYILIPNARKNHSLYGVDNRISDRVACLIEPFTVGCRAARRSNIKSGENAVVFGCGTIGIAAAISLKYFGAEKVMVCDVSDFRLNIARNLGFEICNTDKEDFIETAVKYFSDAHSLNGKTADIDCFIDAAGADEIFDCFMKYGKIESRFVSVAVSKSIRPLDFLNITYSQKSIIGSGGYMPEDVCDVMNIMKSGKWDIESVITNEFSIDNLEKAIQTAGDVNKALSVIIKF